MIAVVAAVEQAVIRHHTLVGHTVPLLQRAAQVAYGPSLAVGAGSLWPKERAWGVEVQLAAEIGHLLAREFGTVAAGSMVGERGTAALSIEATPEHKGGARAGADLGNLGGGVAQPIKPHGLQASAIGAVVGCLVGRLQRACGIVGQLEGSLSHARHCTTFT